MSLPIPELVLGYHYLWKREADKGQLEGVKDPPCGVVLLRRDKKEGSQVRVAPITHTEPRDPETAIEIPPALKNHLGSDGERSWIVLNESNRFFEQIKAQIIALYECEKMCVVERTE